MAEAICIRCGLEKLAPWSKCRRCGYDPKLDPSADALARSVYLSVGRYDDEADQTNYRIELDLIASAIKRGGLPTFEESDLARLKVQQFQIANVPYSAIWGTVVRLFLPAVGFIAFLLGAAYLIRALKH